MAGKRKSLVHKKPAKLDDVRNDINVTPLVDVCLVLLIIFMVIGPMLAKGKEVALPETNFKEGSDDRLEPVVAIDRFGKIWVEMDSVEDPEAMKKRVRDEWRLVAAANSKTNAKDRSGEARVLLKVDQEVTYGVAYPVLIALHELDAGIDLGTAEHKEKKE